MSRGPKFIRRTARALSFAPLFVLLTAGVAFGDIQATANAPPESASCSWTSPSAQCGQWTYWAAVGAMVIGVVLVLVFVVRYLKDAPRFQTEADGKATPGRAQAAAAAGRPLAPPPAGAPAAPSAPPAASSAEAPQGAPASAVAIAEAPVAAEAPPAAAEPAAGVAVATRPPSPRPEPVEPDQATYDKTLAEQLAKGTDRRVAEGRAKAAALKAAREKAAG